MAIAIFDEVPGVEYEWEDVPGVSVLTYAGSAKEQRAKTQEIDYRLYRLPYQRTASEVKDIRTFFIARDWSVEAFFFRDPKQAFREALDLGTSTGGQTEFELPTTGEDQRYYPIDDGDLVLYDDGSPVSVASVDTEDRKVTASAAPTAGSVMTLDCNAYRLVRLGARFRWKGLAPDFFETMIPLNEVPE